MRTARLYPSILTTGSRFMTQHRLNIFIEPEHARRLDQLAGAQRGVSQVGRRRCCAGLVPVARRR